MLFSFEIIKDKTQEVFNNWFEKYDELKFLINNYFGTLYNEYKYVEDIFLNYAFSIEVYHRIKFEEFDAKNDDYFKIRNRILSCIDNSSDKEWLEARLNRKEEKNLASRLLNILELHKESIEGLLEDKELFLRQVVETRHFYVHSNVKKMEYVVDDVKELSIITNKLEIIIQAILMFELGFSQEKINERLKTYSPFEFES